MLSLRFRHGQGINLLIAKLTYFTCVQGQQHILQVPQLLQKRE